MNIVNKLTLRHLKENKSRTVITTLGICVSVAMITAVFVAVASFLNLFGDVTLMSSGDIHAELSVNSTQLEQIKKDNRIAKTGIRIEAENPSYKLNKSKKVYLGIGDFYAGDVKNLEQIIKCDYDGKIPQSENEIAVEEKFISKNGLNWRLGDTVEIPVGTRVSVENGEEFVIGGSYFGGEQFKEAETHQFKITAILHENPATLNYKILRGISADEAKGNVTATIALKAVNYKSLDEVRSIIKQYKIENYSINDDYLETKFAADEDSTLMSTLLPMSLVILAIIIVASVVLIYNAFAMSLSERVRYLGMLASVGATRAQKRASIYFEGLILGAVGIPVGIGAGILGIGITLKSVGDKIISTGMMNGVTSENMKMKVVVPLWAIVGIVLFSIITILISSFIPSQRASKITPIDAIRQQKQIKIKSRKLKSPKIIRKIFGYEGELAYKNLKRNPGKSRVITASIALSVILFLSCNHFCELFMLANDMEMSCPYQVVIGFDRERENDLRAELDTLEDVDAYYTTVNKYFYAGKKIDDILGSFVDNKNLTSKYSKIFDTRIPVFVNAVDDEDFNKLCRENKIDESAYYESSKAVKALLLNDLNRDGSSAVFKDSVVGKTIYNKDNGSENASADKILPKEIEIGGIIDYKNSNYVYNLNAKGSISMFVPASVYSKELNDSSMTLIGIETDNHAYLTERLYDIAESQGFENSYVSDYADTFQAMNTLVFILKVFVYGFISLISLITVANIINTVSTSIDMRRKEFAMLKSVGTTPKGFRKMIHLESLFYAIKALVFGIPLSILASFGLTSVTNSENISFEINWIMYLAVIAAVFAIVELSMLFSVSKLKNDSIIETLKEEIN
ncbi:MAG: ABC transporter permease [Eubacterium sp.]